MAELNGVFMEMASAGHTYGIWAINNPDAYDRLDKIYRTHALRGKWFRQSDSNINHDGDKSALFIEFLGQGLDDISALDQCESIAREMGYCLQIL